MSQTQGTSGEAPSEEWVPANVPPDGADRIDRLVSASLPQVGRKLAAQLCVEGAVLVDGRRVRKGDPVAPGATVMVKLSAWGIARPSPELELEVLLERPDLVVVNKPAGIPTGAIIGRESGTAAGALLFRYPEMAHVGFAPREPGVVHRLDNQTSGVLLAARTQEAFERLREALSSGAIEKRYLALVSTSTLPDSGVINHLLENDPQNRSRVRVARSPGGRTAQTRYRVLKRGSDVDLVEVSASSAFRHQVRVHLAAEGAPLLGDELYGGKAEPLAPRHALHASYIACSDLSMGSFMVEAPLASDLAAIAPSEER